MSTNKAFLSFFRNETQKKRIVERKYYSRIVKNFFTYLAAPVHVLSSAEGKLVLWAMLPLAFVVFMDWKYSFDIIVVLCAIFCNHLIVSAMPFAASALAETRFKEIYLFSLIFDTVAAVLLISLNIIAVAVIFSTLHEFSTAYLCIFYVISLVDAFIRILLE